MQREPEVRRAEARSSAGDSRRPSRRSGSPFEETSFDESRGLSEADIESNCRRIADYILELAREGDFEPALGSLIEALDRGMRDLETDARIRTQRIVDTLEDSRTSAREWRLRRQGCDPYFWG